MILKGAGGKKIGERRSGCFLHLQEERILSVSTLEQQNPASCPDAADPVAAKLAEQHPDLRRLRFDTNGPVASRLEPRGKLELRLKLIAVIDQRRELRPVGGHAVYVDARRFLPHIPQAEFPAQALVVALYREGAVRGVEIGSVMFGRKNRQTGESIYADLELVRLAVPRRVYTNTHLAYVVEVLEQIGGHREELRGLRMVHEAPVLRHFTARFEELA